MVNVMKEYPHILFQKNWNLDEETIFMLGQCDAIVQAIASAPIKPAYREMLLSVSLRKGARATTAIEGNTLSEDEVEKIAEGKNLPPSKEYLQIEVQNVLNALTMIGKEVIREGKEVLLSLELIESFHAHIGKGLGDHFEAVPGKFREAGHNVVVGKYRPPLGEDVKALMIRLCDWMRETFRYENRNQSFQEQIVQAIVAHIYIAMIHPFGDGNGRTARLLEFYILLRAGLPDIASHILSNHYNDTRQEYYRQLDLCAQNRDLSGFIKYAVLGFRDGLQTVLQIIQHNMLGVSWQNYIYESLDSKKAEGKTRAIVKRRRTLALCFPTEKWASIDEIMNEIAPITKEYAKLSRATLLRDIADLTKLSIIRRQSDKYKANIEIMSGFMPQRKGNH